MLFCFFNTSNLLSCSEKAPSWLLWEIKRAINAKVDQSDFLSKCLSESREPTGGSGPALLPHSPRCQGAASACLPGGGGRAGQLSCRLGCFWCSGRRKGLGRGVLLRRQPKRHDRIFATDLQAALQETTSREQSRRVRASLWGRKEALWGPEWVTGPAFPLKRSCSPCLAQGRLQLKERRLRGSRWPLALLLLVVGGDLVLQRRNSCAFGGKSRWS